MPLMRTNTGQALEFEHNPETGEITGPDAELVEDLIDLWPGQGLIYTTQLEDAPDPRHSARDMCVMLAANLYTLSDDQACELPEPEEIPEGAVA